MNRLKTLSTTALFLLLGLAVPAIARQEKQEENAKPPKQEQPAKPQKQEQAKPEKQAQAKPERQEQAKPEKQAQAKPEKQAQAKPQAQQKQQQQKTQQQAKGQQQQQPKQQTASSHGAPQRSEQAVATQHSQPELRLSERGSGRIPDDRFRSHFGRGHSFRMGNPVMVDGYSRFQYGGYWFGFVDPWPANWYYTDAFYIDYVDGGYYMYNPYYPGTRFAITVVI
jgi:outer membrane biosynthesis protein TonB